jgi:DUF4097 and DUF4098 domain-containing protein YvlB
MRPRSFVGPILLIGIGVLFLANNLNPELSVLGTISRFWPFILIVWGALRLIEIMVDALRGKTLPAAGISGGEWTLIVFLSIFGSSLFFVNERVNWPPVGFRMKGIEVFGKAYDYTLDEKVIQAGASPRIIIENSYGNARVAAAEGTEVKVSGRKTVRAFHQHEAEEAGRRVSLEVTKEGDAVVIKAFQSGDSDNSFIATDLEITVPKGARIQGRGRRGDFDITGITGDVEIDSDNAGIRVQDIGGNVRVELRASDVVRGSGVKGNVEIKGTGQDIDLENVDGQVTVAGNYFGELQFRNVIKPVRFEGGLRSRTSEFQVASCPGLIRLGRGNLSLEDVKGPVTINVKSKDVQVSNFTESLELRVERGDIEVRPGTPLAKIDAVTNSGNIELSLPEDAKFALKATAERGDIENDFGEVLKLDESGRGKSHSATLVGSTGSGPQVILRSERGTVRVRKSSPLDAPRAPEPPPAPKPLVVERN